jgi:hypothetical protein
MKKLVVLLGISITVLATNLLSANSETYFKFQIISRSELEKLTRIVSIDNVDGLIVYAYGTDEQLSDLERLGYTYTVLPHPGTLIVPGMAAGKDAKVWDYYPTYGEYVDSMYQFEIDHPGLCKTYDIGLSVQGRSILFVKISDNVDLEEDEPEVMYTSTMHGDETVGYISMLRLIDYLLTNYGTDSLVTRLIDSCEIWINPLANPDGTYRSGDHTVAGAIRLNANYVDLNRNFPDPEDGQHPDNKPWQPETIAMMNFAENHSFVISANLHSGAEVVNYPWDTWARLHVDNDWFINISRAYADSAQYFSPAGYLTDLNNGITNGYAWYTISGGRQDYMNYWHGCREVTLELSHTKLLPEDSLDDHWNYNRASLLNYLENGLYGIRGIVTDAITGDPVFATVTVDGHDSDLDSSRVFTDPDVGDYQRMILPGTYDLTFTATGYYPKTVTSIVVVDETSTRVDATLDPLPETPNLQFASHDAGMIDPGDNVSMLIALKNEGAVDAVNVSAILETDDPYINITQNYSAYPDIVKLGGMETSLSNYEFTILPDCPFSHLTGFSLVISADGGYVDTVEFSIAIGLFVEDFESGDFAGLPWEMGGMLEWTITSFNPYENSFSAKSGAIDDNQYSWVTVNLEVAHPGTLSFYYRVSSEIDDYLSFHIDGVEKDTWSGEIGWSSASYPVEAGSRTFTWAYIKDQSMSGGSDCAWIDLIVFPLLTSSVSISTISLPDWTAGHPYFQELEALNGIGELSWSDKNGELGETNLALSNEGILSGIPTAPGLVSFTAAVTDQGGGFDEKPLSFTINPALQITTASLPDGGVGSMYQQQLEATGGTGTRTWNDKNGDLAGTDFALSQDGVLSGMPAAATVISFTAQVRDFVGSADEAYLSFEIADLPYVCGDANGDEMVNIGDAVFICYHVFKDGPAPDPFESGDANCDDSVNVGDAVYIVNYIFKDGPAPCCP